VLAAKEARAGLSALSKAVRISRLVEKNPRESSQKIERAEVCRQLERAQHDKGPARCGRKHTSGGREWRGQGEDALMRMIDCSNTRSGDVSAER
jgi:hypothetical protein